MRDVLKEPQTSRADTNVTQEEAGKTIKYKKFCMKLQRMWNVNYLILPVIIIRATRIVTKGVKKTLESVPGKSPVDLTQIQLCLERHTLYGKY